MHSKTQYFFDTIRHRLIVSCQAEADSPFNNASDMIKFAKCAIVGGASAIRSEGSEKTKAIIENINVPVIGLIKSEFKDGNVKITGSTQDVEQLLSIGCNIIAIDGTFRLRENLTGPEFIHKVKQKYDCIVMADIANEEEAIACEEMGADCISTTLNGYTPETIEDKSNTPNFNLLKNVISSCKIPVIAEGRFNTPDYASQAIKLGAWSVVVGTAITRPQNITQWFVDKINSELED